MTNMPMSKKPFVHSNLELGYPYFGFPVIYKSTNQPEWRSLPIDGDEHNNIKIYCQIKLPSGKKCCDEHGVFYVSHDFLLLDNKKVICPYCGNWLKVQHQCSKKGIMIDVSNR